MYLVQCQLDQNNGIKLWHIIKKIKIEFSTNSCNQGMISDKDIESQLGILGQLIDKYKCSEKSFESMSDEKLKSASEMFIYLVSCCELSRPWFLFYEDLFKYQPPKQIILTINRLLKSSKLLNEKNVENIATQLWIKIVKTISLKFQQIQGLNKGYDSKTLIQESRNILDIIRTGIYYCILPLITCLL